MSGPQSNKLSMRSPRGDQAIEEQVLEEEEEQQPPTFAQNSPDEINHKS